MDGQQNIKRYDYFHEKLDIHWLIKNEEELLICNEMDGQQNIKRYDYFHEKLDIHWLIKNEEELLISHSFRIYRVELSDVFYISDIRTQFRWLPAS